VRELAFEARRLKLKQAALAETRVTWNDRSTQYTTAIAMLAVALFLVGFAVVLTGAARTAFFLVGVAFALGTIGWAVHIYRLPVPETPDSAIAEAAMGMVDSDAGRQDRAIAAFTRAIDLDGDYVVPFRERAVARVLQANPDFRATGAVTGGSAGLGAAITDARSALDLGGAPDFRTYAFLTLVRLYTGDYGGAVEAADRAIAANEEVPDVRLARSAAQVGAGDGAGAQASLDGALRLLSGSDPDTRTRALAARYVTYLEQVAWASPGREPLVRRLEQEVVGVETRFNLGRRVSGELPARGSVAVEDLRYADGALHVRLRWRGLPAATSLTALGFERPARGGAWVQPAELALFRTVSGSGRQAISVPLTRACTPTRVRVDLYLDGARAVSATGPGGQPAC
jgi:hypothetical protein